MFERLHLACLYIFKRPCRFGSHVKQMSVDLPPYDRVNLHSFTPRIPKKGASASFLPQSKYRADAPTRNLQGAGEIVARLTSFSDVAIFEVFVRSFFDCRIQDFTATTALGDSFFHSVNECLTGTEGPTDTGDDTHLRLRDLAFKDKGELDKLRTAYDDFEKIPGVAVDGSITPSALAKALGICITVLRLLPQDPKTTKNKASFTRTTHSGQSGQCTAKHEIFLFRNVSGFWALHPKEGVEWDIFWREMFLA